MSWIGQSLATQSITIAPMKQPMLKRDTTACPGATAFGPMTRTM